MTKRLTRQQAIDAHCKACTYDPHCGEGNWRQQVEACDIVSCNLWPYRPVSKPNPVPWEERKAAAAARRRAVEADEEA
jgi:hypothetical protein